MSDVRLLSTTRIRREERQLVERLIGKQRQATDADKQLILDMLFQDLTPAPVQRVDGKQVGDWCVIHNQSRLRSQLHHRWRCTACDRDYMRRKRAKDKGEES